VFEETFRRLVLCEELMIRRVVFFEEVIRSVVFEEIIKKVEFCGR
jgi:hypothetical protein